MSQQNNSEKRHQPLSWNTKSINVVIKVSLASFTLSVFGYWYNLFHWSLWQLSYLSYMTVNILQRVSSLFMWSQLSLNILILDLFLVQQPLSPWKSRCFLTVGSNISVAAAPCSWQTWTLVVLGLFLTIQVRATVPHKNLRSSPAADELRVSGC